MTVMCRCWNSIRRALFGGVVGLVAALSGLVATPAPLLAQQQGQDLLKIMAVVNDDVITILDLQARIKLLILTAGISNSPESIRRIAPQVLQAMVNERLKIQEIDRLGYTVSQSEYDRSIGMIEEQIRMKPGQLMQIADANGINRQLILDQIKADLGWVKIVRNTLGAQVEIGDEEINGTLEQLKASMEQPQYLLAEIFLPISAQNSEAEAMSMAERMVQQIRSGASFPALAKQFSQAPTAALGGDMGWVPDNQVAPEIREVISQMQAGQLSRPIKTFSGYYIIMVRDRRDSRAATGDVKLQLSQIFMDGATPPSKVAEIAQQARGLTTCDDFNALAAQSGFPGSGPLGEISAKDLPANIRDTVIALPVEQSSEPLSVQGGTSVVMVCRRTEISNLPTRQQIGDQLMNQRLDMMARRKLRDLRRQAFIDIRS